MSQTVRGGLIQLSNPINDESVPVKQIQQAMHTASIPSLGFFPKLIRPKEIKNPAFLLVGQTKGIGFVHLIFHSGLLSPGSQRGLAPPPVGDGRVFKKDLVGAMKARDEEKKETVKGKIIKFIPLWTWLLNKKV